MKHSIHRRVFAALLTTLMLLALLGGAPASTRAATTPTDKETIQVKDVDELVAAIGQNVTVELAPGVYQLAAAACYGKDTGNPFCHWETASERGYELHISHADGLVLRGAGMDETTLIAEDRYASVLCFAACQGLTVTGLTAGHSPEPGFCSGGVMHLLNCSDVQVEDCGLFGCGTVGVWASSCTNVTVASSRIYECSESAVTADSCRELQVLDSEIDHNGWRSEDGSAYCLFNASGGDGFTVSGCRVHDNQASFLLQCSNTRNARFLSDRVEYNTLQNAFALFEETATVDGCSFHRNDMDGWYAQGFEQSSLTARDAAGQELSWAELEAMEHRYVQVTGSEEISLGEPTEVPAGGEVTVTTVDEFLAAIGPDRTIVVEGKGFSLADAANYGGIGTPFYSWEECYDGHQLVISDVSGLTIRAAGADPAATTLTAEPRYANVICFQRCEGVRLEGLTLGHSNGAGECSGGVVDMSSCSGMSLLRCRLYGCGTLGVYAWYSSDIKLTDCEIYDCSYGGVVLGSVFGAAFLNCRIHDVPSPALSLYDCNGVLWNGKAVHGEHFDVTPGGELKTVTLG